jgi:hypothetical protein
VHDPAKIVLDLALTLAPGGDCLADIALLRAEPDLFGLWRRTRRCRRRSTDSPPTRPRRCAIDTARAAARRQAWALAGEHPSDLGPAATPNRQNHAAKTGHHRPITAGPATLG